MTCATAQEQIQLALDGRLTASEREALASHVDACAECRRYEQQLAALERRLAAEASRDAQVAAPDDLLARLGLGAEAPVLAAAPVPVKRRSAWRTWLPAGMAAAALVVALGVGQFVTQPTEVATVEPALSDAEAIHLWLDPEAELVSWAGDE